MTIQYVCFCFVLFFASASSAADTVTFYRDGALHRQEAGAVKGTIETPLATGLLEHSLTITPARGTTLLSVDTVATGVGMDTNRELDVLLEQRRRLDDRLQALETRESIFTSAAKSQSGKAPRKTKANPDPMQSIRQGTDFAIAQLEAVYTARRKTTQEIQKIDARITTARKGRQPAETTLRIAVSPPRGSVTIRYATAERGWKPEYNLYLTGDGTAKLQLSARASGSVRGSQIRFSPASLAESTVVETFPVQSGSATLATYILPVTEEGSVEGVFNRFSGVLTNTTAHYLPEGDSGLFRRGVYLGKVRFEGLSSGRSKRLSLGR